MKLAAMQPYYFPYVGYFELMKEADIFVCLDSAQYIRRGWINRNRISSPGGDWHYLTIPVRHAPRDTPIRDIVISSEWIPSHMKSLKIAYGKKATYHPLYGLLEECLSLYGKGERRLVKFLNLTIDGTARFLGVHRENLLSTSLPKSIGSPSEQIVSYCRLLSADRYINASGGKHVYDTETFDESGIDLKFMDATKHVNILSILDICIGDGLNCL